jgi:hypothetical protein
MALHPIPPNFLIYEENFLFFSHKVLAVIIVVSFTILGALSSIIRELQEALATRQYVCFFCY